MKRSDLDKRMKDYEKRDRFFLQRKVPVIMRLDMRAGHTFTRGFIKPFDSLFTEAMQETAQYLCENVQGCKLSFQQSDEISLLLVDYEKITSECFFEYRIDKLCSITASMATFAFNRAFNQKLSEFKQTEPFSNYSAEDLVDNKLICAYERSSERGAVFDSRCFNLPKEEVANYFFWRQWDASKSSIQMIGRVYFSYKQLQHKSCSEIQDMLMTKKGINWNDLPIDLKRGTCCIRKEVFVPCGIGVGVIKRHKWVIDEEIPIFKGDDRYYVERFVYL